MSADDMIDQLTIVIGMLAAVQHDHGIDCETAIVSLRAIRSELWSMKGLELNDS